MEKIYGEKGIILPEKLVIPKIDDKTLAGFYRLLKPIVTIDEVKYLLKEFSLEQLRDISYIWDRNEDKRDVVDSNKLEPVEDFLCLHTWGYYGLFKPSIAEILAQVPEKTICEANVFEIIEKPETRADVFRYPEVVDNGFHLSKVRSYKLHR